MVVVHLALCATKNKKSLIVLSGSDGRVGFYIHSIRRVRGITGLATGCTLYVANRQPENVIVGRENDGRHSAFLLSRFKTLARLFRFDRKSPA